MEANKNLPLFSGGQPASSKIAQILKDLDDVSQFEIVALARNERAQLLIHIQDWCDRFAAYDQQALTSRGMG